ncbi:MAG: DUF5818 domain-containing protein [Alphaproteobacteria bacterium]
MTILAPGAALGLALLACAGGERDTVPAGALCVRGALTDEGVECPALRADDGGLYTLVGEIAGLKAGDAACVCGEVATISFCMQGTTLVVTQVRAPDDC